MTKFPARSSNEGPHLCIKNCWASFENERDMWESSNVDLREREVAICNKLFVDAEFLFKRFLVLTSFNDFLFLSFEAAAFVSV
jgi:hypothetical protein